MKRVHLLTRKEGEISVRKDTVVWVENIFQVLNYFSSHAEDMRGGGGGGLHHRQLLQNKVNTETKRKGRGGINITIDTDDESDERERS